MKAKCVDKTWKCLVLWLKALWRFPTCNGSAVKDTKRSSWV